MHRSSPTENARLPSGALAGGGSGGGGTGGCGEGRRSVVRDGVVRDGQYTGACIDGSDTIFPFGTLGTATTTHVKTVKPTWTHLEPLNPFIPHLETAKPFWSSPDPDALDIH